MKIVKKAINPENGETEDIEISKDRTDKILHQMDSCKWYVDPENENGKEVLLSRYPHSFDKHSIDVLHVIGVDRYSLEHGDGKFRYFHVVVHENFPDTKEPADMFILHGNTFFTQNDEFILFDSVEEQRKFWNGMMSNLMTSEEIELLRKAELESENDKVEKPTTAQKDEPKAVELNCLGDLGRIVDLYEIDVVTKMINSLDKFRNASAITALEEKAISLWSEYIGKVGKKQG